MTPLILFTLLAQNPDPVYLESLYARQDPYSLTKQLYFYAEYRDTPEGARAKEQILKLLNCQDIDPVMPLDLTAPIFDQLLKAVFKTTINPITLDEHCIEFIQKISKTHKNRELKGSSWTSIQQLQEADSSDIDVGRGMLLLSFGSDEEGLKKIRTYEAVLDFMSVCIKARLGSNPTHEQIVHAMNHFIFYELGFRFPPQSEHEEKIDTYTILPSVLDNRQGVCLGVCLLYYSLAQRLGLNLDIYTPPGHIFLSLHKDLNIETTARGIHIPLESYLSLHMKTLTKRNQKELLGMALFNQASVFLTKQEFKQAAALYKQALVYIPHDLQILELLGSCYIMNGELKKAHATFSELKTYANQTLLSTNYLLEDFFKGLVTPQGLKAVFQNVDPTMTSLLKKAQHLEEVHKKSPKFRSALFQLGITYLQLHQYQKALSCFEKLYPNAPDDPALVYYLTELAFMRYDRPKTLYYKQQLKSLLEKNGYTPKNIIRLFEEIETLWPSKIDKR